MLPSSGKSHKSHGGVAQVVLPRSGLGPQAIAARLDFASLHHGQAAPQQPQHKGGWSHHPSQQLHKPRDGAWLVTGPGPCCSSQYWPCAKAAERTVVWVLPAMCTALARWPLYLKRKKGERESCSIVLLQVEKGWTNSNQTPNRNSSQAETFFCQVSALGEFLQLSNKLLKQRLRPSLARGF